jgi:hypothetical protein
MDLLCVGDIALAEEGLKQWQLPMATAPSEQARVLFNWELPIGGTTSPIPRSSGPRLLAHPDSPAAIRGWAPGFAALATNHILDAGAEGLADTIGLLHQAGFRTVGAGLTQEEITRPLFWETEEGRLAIINWVFPETHPDWMAAPGPNCWPGLEGANRAVQDLRQRADWLVIVVHWSDELFPYPRPEDRAIARKLAHMGADLVVGHHPHVVRGMEIIGSCPVFYSIGNFYFSDLADHHGGWVVKQAPRNREGLGVQIGFERGRKPEYQAVSFWQAGGRAVTDPARRAARRMEWGSRALRRFQDLEYSEWYADQRANFDRWICSWHFGVRRLGISGSIRYCSRKAHSTLTRTLATRPLGRVSGLSRREKNADHERA